MKNDELKIEKGIPIPKNIGEGNWLSPLGSALRKLEIGDSLYTEGNLSSTNQACQRHLRAGNYAKRKEGKGYRIWRIK